MTPGMNEYPLLCPGDAWNAGGTGKEEVIPVSWVYFWISASGILRTYLQNIIPSSSHLLGLLLLAPLPWKHLSPAFPQVSALPGQWAACPGDSVYRHVALGASTATQGRDAWEFEMRLKDIEVLRDSTLETVKVT